MGDPEASLWLPPPSRGNSASDLLLLLGRVPLFESLTTAELKKIIRLFHVRAYRQGETVFKEGDPGAGMYVVIQGGIQVTVRRKEGGEKDLGVLSTGEFFGEMALLEDAPRSATCVAVDQTELLGFFRPDLEGLIDRDPRLGSKICWNLARLMATRLRTVNESLKAGSALAPGPQVRAVVDGR